MARMDNANQASPACVKLAKTRKLTPNEQLALYRKTLRLFECFPRLLYTEALLQANDKVIYAAKDLLKDVKKATTSTNIAEASVLADDIQTFILLRDPARGPVHELVADKFIRTL